MAAYVIEPCLDRRVAMLCPDDNLEEAGRCQLHHLRGETARLHTREHTHVCPFLVEL